MPYVTENNLTDLAVERWNNIDDPRLRKVMTSLITHLHAFVRDIEPTQEEWAAAIDFLTRTGQICTDKRQEFILLSDVLGVSMLVDAINHRLPSGATPSTVEGPFHVAGSPEIPPGGNLADGAPGEACFVIGTVCGTDGRQNGGAILDIWQTDGEGLYEAQRDVDGPWMRGFYRTGPDGSYAIRTVAPIGYTIPMDGTVGELMNRTRISHFRPAHIHFHVKASGYQNIVTHLFRDGDEYIDSDVVFGVKAPLIVKFEEQPSGSKAPSGEILNEPFYMVNYDFVLQSTKTA